MAKQKNIGDLIQDAVQDAINSQDFSKLNETISQSIGKAAENIGKSLEEAQKNARNAQKKVQNYAGYSNQGQARRPTFNEQWINQPYMEKQRRQQQEKQELAAIQNERYLPTTGMQVGGYLMAAGGGVLTTASAIGTLGCLLVTEEFGFTPALICLVITAASAVLVGAGIKKVSFASRFKNYIRIIGKNTYCDIKELAVQTQKPESFVLKNIKKMLRKNMFRSGHIDEKGTCLMVTDEAYSQYKTAQAQLEERKRQEKMLESIEQENRKKVEYSEEVQAVLDEGNAYIAKIHASNDAIPGVEISRKISHMENIIGKIFQRVKEHPEVIPDLKKLMEYYLPTTVKLLDAYEDLDRQPIQGENITSSKKEIEETLDTLNTAFEKLLDSIFRDMAWDVSTDISVLHTVLAQEGLTEDVFGSTKNQNK